MNQFLICCFLLVGCVHDNEERQGQQVFPFEWECPISVNEMILPLNLGKYSPPHITGPYTKRYILQRQEHNGCHKVFAGGVVSFHVPRHLVSSAKKNKNKKKEAGPVEGTTKQPPQKFPLNLNSTCTEVFLIIYLFK